MATPPVDNSIFHLLALLEWLSALIPQPQQRVHGLGPVSVRPPPVETGPLSSKEIGPSNSYATGC